MHDQVVCQNPDCGKLFWSKVKHGVPLETFCVECRNLLRQQQHKQQSQRYRLRRFNRKLKEHKSKEEKFIRKHPEFKIGECVE